MAKKKIDRLKDKVLETRKKYCDFMDEHQEMSEEDLKEVDVLLEAVNAAKKEYREYSLKIKK